MGRPKSKPASKVGELIHEHLGAGTYRHLADLIERVHGIRRNPETIRFICLGRAPGANYIHHGARRVKKGEPSTLALIVDVLGIDEAKMAEAMMSDRLGAARDSLSTDIRYCALCGNALDECECTPLVLAIAARESALV